MNGLGRERKNFSLTHLGRRILEAETARIQWLVVMVRLRAVEEQPLVSTLLTRSLKPLRRLASGVWRDWTRISFALYGGLLLALLFSFDEVQGEAYIIVGLPLLLALGALAYMRSRSAGQRVISLVSGLASC